MVRQLAAALRVNSSLRALDLIGAGLDDEGMQVLNSTASLQQRAEDLEISRYDAVLIVAARAKDNAYQSAEEQPGYIGSSFGGPMGNGMRRPPPATSIGRQTWGYTIPGGGGT